MNKKQMRDAVPSATIRRILEEGRIPCAYIPIEACQKLKEWFDANPDTEQAFLFYDGHVESYAAYSNSLSSRTAQLVSISSKGWPVPVCRWGVEYRLAPEVETNA